MIEVVEAGPLTSIQDAIGRPGWRHLGVPTGGAADAWSARLANRLVGNPDGAALLEVTLGPATVRFDAPCCVAVVGGLEAAGAGGLPLPTNEGIPMRAGSTLTLLPGTGARGYLAVGGAIVVAGVLGSTSTDLRTGFGGHDGRALRAGDRLEVGPGGGRPSRWTGGRDDGPIRLVAGPHPRALDALLSATWTVGVEADRAGIRLDGPAVGDHGEVASMGLPLGAIQVPADGRPIIMLADRPVTGGYPVPACVIGADVGRVAQLRTGDRLRFVSSSAAAAAAALARAEGELAALEPIEPAPDDELGWAGSHD